MEILILLIVLAFNIIVKIWPLLIVLIIGAIIVWIISIISANEERKMRIDSFLNQSLPHFSQYKPFLLIRSSNVLNCETLCSYINCGYELKNELMWHEKVHVALCEKRDVCIRESRRKQAKEYEAQIAQQLSDIQELKKRISELNMEMPLMAPSIQQSFNGFKEALKKSKNKLDYYDVLFGRYNAVFDEYSEEINVVYLPQLFVQLNKKTHEMEVYEYSEIHFKEHCKKDYIRNPEVDDDIIYMTYRYARKDGERDMRYSYENNPEIYCVHRGSILVDNISAYYEVSFKNKKYTQAFSEAFETHRNAKQIEHRRRTRSSLPTWLSNRDQFALQMHVGDKVQHKTYGLGKIVSILEGKYINILFEAGEKKFKYPEAFEEGYLSQDIE